MCPATLGGPSFTICCRIRGPQPIGADQRRAGDALAGRQERRSAVAVLFVADDIAVGPQFNSGFGLARLDEDAVQITAMDHGIRISEPLAEALGQIDMGDFLRGDCIHQPQLVDEHGDRSRGVSELKPVERVECIWAELNACADFLIARCALEDGDPESLLRER